MDLVLVFWDRIGSDKLQALQIFGGQAQRELMASSLILETIYTPQGLGHGHIEYQVPHGAERNGHPPVLALQPCGLHHAAEENCQKDKQDLEKLPELLLLEIHGSFFLQCLLEMDLNDRVQCLQSGFSWNKYTVAAVIVYIRFAAIDRQGGGVPRRSMIACSCHR